MCIEIRKSLVNECIVLFIEQDIYPNLPDPVSVCYCLKLNWARDPDGFFDSYDKVSGAPPRKNPNVSMFELQDSSSSTLEDEHNFILSCTQYDKERKIFNINVNDQIRVISHMFNDNVYKFSNF